ncbi:MAG: cysteine--tRNA ligase [Rickettsiales bacterium]|jgi:cysteinyl-tRNA synthetase|nr:cysteine--tRNA ligase [Rickettsiales bacterium]
MIKLYNTISRRVEEFVPLVPNQVSFYSCGPTVYHYAHIGNLRSLVLMDLLKRMFLANGYAVKNVMNYTDVGHLTDDGNDGDDKMERGAARENKSVWDVANFYIDSVNRDMADLNILPPTATPRATDFISEQIDMIKKLEGLGYTYEIPNDGIYYDTSKFPNYGPLTGGGVAGHRAGARVDFNSAKRNDSDFALWKFARGENRAMEWDSPWGRGFPGWHIECSAMSLAILGPHFDIHTGGIDATQTHHPNEIAQSEPIVGAPWVKYWVHGEFLIDRTGGKMAKSAGEFLTLSVLKERGYDPMAYRYLLLQSNYGSQLAFSFDALDAAANGYKNLVRRISEFVGAAANDTDAARVYKNKILDAVNDNLGTPTALVIFGEMLRDKNLTDGEKLFVVRFVDELLGLMFIQHAEKLKESENVDVPTEILELANARTAAKAEKDWARADELRTAIESKGWKITDTADGVKITKG